MGEKLQRRTGKGGQRGRLSSLPPKRLSPSNAELASIYLHERSALPIIPPKIRQSGQFEWQRVVGLSMGWVSQPVTKYASFRIKPRFRLRRALNHFLRLRLPNSFLFSCWSTPPPSPPHASVIPSEHSFAHRCVHTTSRCSMYCSQCLRQMQSRKSYEHGMWPPNKLHNHF